MEFNLSTLRNLAIKRLDTRILLLSIGFTILQSYFFYGYSLGIGYPLFIWGFIGVIRVLGRARESPHWEHQNMLFWWVSAIFFACMVAVRKEELLTFFNVAISLYSVAIFVSKGNFILPVWHFPIFRTLGLPMAFAHNAWELIRGLRSLFSLGEKGKIISIVSISLPIIGIYFILFSAGDLSFREAFKDIGDTLLEWATNIIPIDLFGRVLFAIAVLPFIGGILHATVYGMVYPYKEPKPQIIPPQDWTVIFTPLYAACLAFLPFSFLQIQSAFKGHANISSSLSYAAYAKDGYFALLLSALLTLGIIIFVGRRTYLVTQVNPRVKYICFALLCQVGLLVGGTFYRLSLYQEAYGLTLTRFYGYALLIGLFGIFILLGWRIYQDRGFALNEFPIVRWGLLLFALINILNPAGFVAKSNLQSTSMIWTVDAYYLTQLSADSLPSRIRHTRSREDLQSLLRGEFRSADCISTSDLSCVTNPWVRWSNDLNQSPNGPWFTWHLNNALIRFAIKNRLNDFAK
jgi:Domain of unknown function (DUF4173)